MRLAAIMSLAVMSAVILFWDGEPQLWNVLGDIGFMWLFFTPVLIDPPFFMPFRRKGKIVFDEHGAKIVQRATTQAFGAFWYVFPIICIGLYLFLNAYRTEGMGMISSGALTIIGGGGGILIALVQSVSILAQYKKGGNDGDK